MSFAFQREHSRHHKIDQTLERVDSLLTDDVLQGLDSGVPDHLKEVIDSIYVPNRRGDRLITPKSYRTDASIPLYSLSPGEVVQASRYMATMHRAQKASLSAFALSRDQDPELAIAHANDELEDAFFDDQHLALVNERGQHILGATKNFANVVSIGSLQRVVRARPIILISTLPTQSTRAGALEVIHQVAAADHRLHRRPTGVRNSSKKLDRESENEYAHGVEIRVAYLSLAHLSDHQDEPIRIGI